MRAATTATARRRPVKQGGSIKDGVVDNKDDDESARRVPTACQHCRHRKIRCDGALPSCVCCASARRPCIYKPVSFEENQAARARKANLREAKALLKSKGLPIETIRPKRSFEKKRGGSASSSKTSRARALTSVPLESPPTPSDNPAKSYFEEPSVASDMSNMHLSSRTPSPTETYPSPPLEGHPAGQQQAQPFPYALSQPTSAPYTFSPSFPTPDTFPFAENLSFAHSDYPIEYSQRPLCHSWDLPTPPSDVMSPSSTEASLYEPTPYPVTHPIRPRLSHSVSLPLPTTLPYPEHPSYPRTPYQQETYPPSPDVPTFYSPGLEYMPPQIPSSHQHDGSATDFSYFGLAPYPELQYADPGQQEDTSNYVAPGRDGFLERTTLGYFAGSRPMSPVTSAGYPSRASSVGFDQYRGYSRQSWR